MKKIIVFVMCVAIAVSMCMFASSASEIDSDCIFSLEISSDSVKDTYGGTVEMGFGSYTVETDPQIGREVINMTNSEGITDTQIKMKGHQVDWDNLDDYTLEVYFYLDSSIDPSFICNLTNGDCFLVYGEGFLTYNPGNSDSNLSYNMQGKGLVDQWVHVVYSCEQENVVMYVNGEYAKTLEGETYNFDWKSSDTIYIGTYNGDKAPLKIAALNIYDVAATDDDVAELYTTATDGTSDVPVATAEPTEVPATEAPAATATATATTEAPDGISPVIWVVLIALGVVIIAAIVVLVIILTKKGGKGETKAEVTVEAPAVPVAEETKDEAPAAPEAPADENNAE